ncbi:hypothetical protein HK44_010465 [Pseudomonas fluorescens HK44]|uniref:Uncharacterized protein n=1 Tax=Pseudomonas fluorescens HK44 TaxID=1042209 RepID=A0A010RZM2_PSEFL|nr:hypothetical protein HK44_010465 [Pseudomonas fluorescens HK44]
MIICRFGFGFGLMLGLDALLGLEGWWIALRVPVTERFFFG